MDKSLKSFLIYRFCWLSSLLNNPGRENDMMSGPLSSPRHSHFEGGHLIILLWPVGVQAKGRGACLISNQKLRVITLSGEGMSKVEIGWKLGLLCQIFSLPVNAEEKFLKKIKIAVPVNTWIRKQNSFIADVEKVWVVWIEDLTSYNIPLIQYKALTLFHAVKARRGEKLREKSLKAAEVGLWSLRKEAVSMTSKCNVQQQMLLMQKI